MAIKIGLLPNNLNVKSHKRKTFNASISRMILLIVSFSRKLNIHSAVQSKLNIAVIQVKQATSYSFGRNLNTSAELSPWALNLLFAL